MRPRPCRRLQLLASVATTLLLLILETRTTARAAHPSRVAECLARAADSGQLDELELHEAAVEDQQLGYLEPIRSLATRRALSLNGLYDFCFDAARAGFQQRWFERPLAEACPPSEFHRMPVPSAFNELLSNETARNFMGWTWYQTQFRLWPASLAGRLLVQFESINYLGLVWAQVLSAPGRKGRPARLVGAHAGGHLPVVVDLSELLETLRPLEGLEELGLELRLSVAVSNQLSRDTIPSGQMVNLTQVAGRPAFKFRPDFDFFHFAGLLGDVQLVRLPPVYIKRASVSRQPDGRLNLRLCLAQTIQAFRWQLGRCRRAGPQVAQNSCRVQVNKSAG